eukprot:763179-Hanusia_phi.AAC.7
MNRNPERYLKHGKKQRARANPPQNSRSQGEAEAANAPTLNLYTTARPWQGSVSTDQANPEAL